MIDKGRHVDTPARTREPRRRQTQSQEKQLSRVGILQCITKLDDTALRYLILSMNSRQTFFQFEFVPFDDQDEFLEPLLASGVTGRPSPHNMQEFYDRERRYFQYIADCYERPEEAPDYFQIISAAGFRDNYFYVSNGALSVVAMGDWKRAMAPPSILEFIQIIVLKGALLALCPELDTHLGTCGCVMDFSVALSDARQRVLVGWICQTCESILSEHGYSDLVAELRELLSRRWLGSPSDPAAPAGIISKLGYDLFITKGLKPNLLESARITLAQEGVKQILTVIGTVVAAAVLALLGYAAVSGHSTPAAPQPTTTRPAITRTQLPRPAIKGTQP